MNVVKVAKTFICEHLLLSFLQVIC